MRKRYLTSIALAILVIGTSIGYAQNQMNETRFNKVMITRESAERQYEVISAVNNGELPISALSEAKQLLDKRPDLIHSNIRTKHKDELSNLIGN
ncbi:hypothetical protein SAMN05444162_4661 [Paenibacillaceae bacterium GAS479]|nr:hypothetical protein SAMN05444162_4661 [Paenibacillaceae bacterium GAS479]